jgi:hypothetical protein
MKKLVSLLTVMLLLILPVSGQRLKDAIYLKNGSIIYGKLLEVSDDKYKIQGSDGSVFIFPSDEVEKFTRENPRLATRKVSGFGFEVEAGVLMGSQASELDAPFSFSLALDYTYETKNIFGLGSGVEFLNSTFTPLFVQYKHIFSDRKTTPFIFLRGGGLLHPGNSDEGEGYPYYQNYAKDFSGGPMFGIGIGISWAREDNENYLSFAYRYAETSYKQNDYNYVTYTYKNYYNRLEVKFGFRF